MKGIKAKACGKVAYKSSDLNLVKGVQNIQVRGKKVQPELFVSTKEYALHKG